ncbi:AAA domain-containing protein [Phenylobacterium sp.]|uniref:AAA domain-containing protein n=1 Tax=Phenylobacterium sp. TaxID=1871053 RepID=UPI003D2E2732
MSALAAAFPPHWLMYASLTCYPPRQHPIEIDVFVVTDDRVLLLELKDLNGTLTAKGDKWLLNGAPRGRSPVALLAEKARKVKGLIGGRIAPLAKISVDFRVVLTGTATRDNLLDADKRYCWTLPEACSIVTRANRQRLLGTCTLLSVTPCRLEQDFGRLLGDPRLFAAREDSWDGYVRDEQNLFVHPRGAWRDHRVQQARDARMKALLRSWRFDKLPANLNSGEMRRLVADREIRVIAHLRDCESWIVERGCVLTPAGAPKDEILTDHFELFDLPGQWTPMRRYLERHRESLTADQRISLVATLLNIFAELHAKGIAHRDLGAACIWVGSPTRLALTGLMSAQVPQDTSVFEWLPLLRGYGPDLPEDLAPDTAGSARQRDVYLLGAVASEVLLDTPWTGSVPEGANDTLSMASAVLTKATAQDPKARYEDAQQFAAAFGDVFSDPPKGNDPSRLDAYETEVLPLVAWRPPGPTTSRGGKVAYESLSASDDRVHVKLWTGLQRGTSDALNLTMLTLFEAAARLKTSPVPGLPMVEAAALSPIGPFVVTRHVDGTPLADWTAPDLFAAAQVIEQLCQAIIALHDLGATHGDLSPSNVLVRTTSDPVELTVIDLFDLSPTGIGRVRNLAWAPADWELQSDLQIDRFAVCKIAKCVLESVAVAGDRQLFDLCTAELERSTIETLEPLLDAARAVLRRREQPPADHITVFAPNLAMSELSGDDGLLWTNVTSGARGVRTYTVTSLDRRLTFHLRNGVVEDCRFDQLSFWDLSAVRRQVQIPLRLSLRRGASPHGFDVLARRLEAAAASSAPPPSPSMSLAVGELWQRSIEVEGDLAPEVVITGRAAELGMEGAYTYEAERPFDFDGEADVEVRALVQGRMRTIGRLDVGRLSDSVLVVLRGTRPLMAGETIFLVDRLARISLDRRRRAVMRIMRRESAVPDLLEYFEPGVAKTATMFDVSVSNEDLEKYKLNSGQRRAFRDVLATGPVGLLQGPPGTGKTRFIAALAHWLVTKGGARKILLASQSHEAVNNAAEELIKFFGRYGGRLDLLRIGARGLTDRLRPYHTTSLREGFEQRFIVSLKARLAAVATAIGVSRALVHDLVDIEIDLVAPARRLERIDETLTKPDIEAGELQRLRQARRTQTRPFLMNATRRLGREVAADETPSSVVSEAQLRCIDRHPLSSPADVEAALRVIELGNEWVDTLRSGHRNFDEFLAKTRTIVTGTCVGLGQTRVRLEATSFDWVIVDEAARCTSSELAVPLQLGRRILLVGDHLQLPPHIPHDLQAVLREELSELSDEERQRSDFERAFTSSYGREVGRILDEQYRMPEGICQLVSEVYYAPQGVKLETSEDREPDTRFQTALPQALQTETTWVDTSKNSNATEGRKNRNRDTWNDAEVEAILKILHQIHGAKSFAEPLTRSEDPAIGVICMYKAQKHRLEQAFAEHPFSEAFRRSVKIDTVDAYQGKQNKIIIVSLVRNNRERRPGHVGSNNRCNVALSRAQERLVIVGAADMWRSERCRSSMRAVLERVAAGKGGASAVIPAGELEG